MSDWTPAMLRALSGATIVFVAGDIPVLRTFSTAAGAVGFVAEAGMSFSFSAERNAVRNSAGQVLDLPVLDTPQRFVDHTECTLILSLIHI